MEQPTPAPRGPPPPPPKGSKPASANNKTKSKTITKYTAALTGVNEKPGPDNDPKLIGWLLDYPGNFAPITEGKTYIMYDAAKKDFVTVDAESPEAAKNAINAGKRNKTLNIAKKLQTAMQQHNTGNEEEEPWYSGDEGEEEEENAGQQVGNAHIKPKSQQNVPVESVGAAENTADKSQLTEALKQEGLSFVTIYFIYRHIKSFVNKYIEGDDKEKKGVRKQIQGSLLEAFKSPGTPIILNIKTKKSNSIQITYSIIKQQFLLALFNPAQQRKKSRNQVDLTLEKTSFVINENEYINKVLCKPSKLSLDISENDALSKDDEKNLKSLVNEWKTDIGKNKELYKKYVFLMMSIKNKLSGLTGKLENTFFNAILSDCENTKSLMSYLLSNDLKFLGELICMMYSELFNVHTKLKTYSYIPFTIKVDCTGSRHVPFYKVVLYSENDIRITEEGRTENLIREYKLTRFDGVEALQSGLKTGEKLKKFVYGTTGTRTASYKKQKADAKAEAKKTKKAWYKFGK